MKYFPYSELTLEQILTFLNVAKNLNMTKSADELSVTQSAISKRISLLEDITGVILFSKHKNILRLTPAGKFLYKKLSHEYKNIRDAIDGARSIQKNSSQTLKIGMSHIFNPEVLVKIISEYTSIHPDLNVNVDVWTGESIMDRIVEGDLDILLCHVVHITDFKELKYKPYSKMPMFWIVKSDHPVFQKEDFQISDFINYPMVCNIGKIEELTVLTEDIFKVVGKYKNNLRIASSIQEMYFDVMINNKIGITTMNEIWQNPGDNLRIFPCEICYDVCICYRKEANDKVMDFVKIFEKYVNKSEIKKTLDDKIGLTLYNELLSDK